MKNEGFKVAVIGVGSLGQHHARIYSELEGVDLIAVVDTDFDRAKEIAEKTGCTPYSDPADVLGKVDAVSVVVPTFAHHAIAKPLLAAGIHVLLEKPITCDLAEANDLIETAKASGAVLQVGHIEQFNAGVKKLRAELSAPRFIECHRVGPFAGRGTDVHVILDLMIHDIDIILSLVPSKLVEIRAAGTSVLTEMIDIANVRLAFEDGCVANITTSRVSPQKLRKIRIFQPEAYFSLDYAAQDMTVYRRVMKDGVPQITVDQVTADKEEPLKAELVSFIDALKSGAAPQVSGEDGREALDVALQIVALIAEGKSSGF